MKSDKKFWGMKLSREEWNKAIGKKPLRALIVPLLAAIIILLNRYSDHNSIPKMEMNLFLLIVFFVELLVVIASSQNITKLFWLVGTMAVFLEAVIYNFFVEGKDFPITSTYEIINSLCGAWTALFIPVFAYLVVVCVRAVRWTQEDWEKIKKLWREERIHRLEEYIRRQEMRKNSWIERYKIRDLLKNEKIGKKTKRQEFKKNIEVEKYKNAIRKWGTREEYRRKIKDIRRQRKIEVVGRKGFILRIKEVLGAALEIRVSKIVKGGLKIILPIIITGAIVYFYIFIPMKDEYSKVNDWVYQAGQFMENFEHLNEDNGSETGGGENQKEIENDLYGGFNAIIEYTIFYIALTGTAVSIIFLLWKTVEGLVLWIISNNKSYGGFSGFFMEYSTPLVILIMAVSVLLTFVDEGAIMDNLPQLFMTLAGVVMSIIIVLICVDAIRLILNQSIAPNSLLRTAMHLTFILFINNVMGIIVGVLTGINLKETIISLLYFFFHVDDIQLYQNVKETLDVSLNKEVNEIKRGIKKGSAKVNSASRFSSFSTTHWSSRR